MDVRVSCYLAPERFYVEVGERKKIVPVQMVCDVHTYAFRVCNDSRSTRVRMCDVTWHVRMHVWSVHASLCAFLLLLRFARCTESVQGFGWY